MTHRWQGPVAAVVGALLFTFPGEASQRRVGGSVGGRVDSSWLEQWLATLKIEIPAFSQKLGGFEVALTDGTCGDIDLQNITTEANADNRFSFQARGIAINCELRYHVDGEKGALYKGGIGFKVKESILAGSIAFLADDGTPPLPGKMDASSADCMAGTRFHNGDIQFPEAPPLFRWFLDLVLKPFIEGFVNGKFPYYSLASVFCTQLDSAINSRSPSAMHHMGEAIRNWTNSPSKSRDPPYPLPGKLKDYVDLAANPAVRLVEVLLRRVLGNASSPYGVDALATRYFGPDGKISLDGLGIFPITQHVDIPHLGHLTMTVRSLEFGHLNSVSELLLVARAQELTFRAGVGRLDGVASLGLVVTPDPSSPLHGTTLIEDFDVNISVRGLHATASALIALNGTGLKGLAVDQLASPGCLFAGWRSHPEVSPLMTAAGLKLALVQPTVSPPDDAPGLEMDVDGMLTKVSRSLLGQYWEEVQTLGDHALSVTLRDALNEKLQKTIMASGSCPEPGPAYASMPVSNATLVAAIVSALGALVLLIFGHVFIGMMAAPRASASQASTSTAETPKPRDAHGRTLAGGASSSSPRRTPGGAAAEQPAQVRQERWADFALAQHPALTLPVRMALPLLVICTVFLFISSNSGPGAQVMASVTVNEEEAVSLPPVFSFSLVSSVKDMWDGGVYPLAILIAAFSGFWPYLKLFLMLFCWFTPPKILSISRRQALFEFLDAYGKWSLVDTFVLVLFMVAFSFDLQAQGNEYTKPIFQTVGEDARFLIYIHPTLGFHTFLIATVMSLVVGHGMTACHRRALKRGEYGEREEYIGREVLAGGRRRLCNVLRPPAYVAGKRFVYGPASALGVSLALVLFGIFAETFQFKFLGLAGLALGPEASVRPYSVISLDLALPEASNAPDTLGTRWIQAAFMFFSAVIMPVYLIILLCLWTAPLSNKMQKDFLVAAQVLNAWSGLDVFCCSIMASVLEIRQFALFIVGDKCDMINKIIGQTPLADKLEGPKTCFDVDSELRPGFYILALSAIIALVTGHVTLHRCSKALHAGSGLGSPSSSVLTRVVRSPSRAVSLGLLPDASLEEAASSASASAASPTTMPSPTRPFLGAGGAGGVGPPMRIPSMPVSTLPLAGDEEGARGVLSSGGRD